MTVEIKDILLKAAEDVQQGMWCKGVWFGVLQEDGFIHPAADRFPKSWAFKQDVDVLSSKYRCAEGSIIYATRLLGGQMSNAEDAIYAVGDQIGGLWRFNDDLPNDPFEAGQQLAELFRTTADSL